MSLGKIFGVIKGRKLAKQQYKLDKLRGQAAIRDLEREMEFRASEDPREQAGLTQGLFARGLGKSTIASEEMGRLRAMQSRRLAALQERRTLAHRGLALLKKRRKFERFMEPFNWYDMLSSAAGSAAGYMGGGGAGGGTTSVAGG